MFLVKNYLGIATEPYLNLGVGTWLEANATIRERATVRRWASRPPSGQPLIRSVTEVNSCRIFSTTSSKSYFQHYAKRGLSDKPLNRISTDTLLCLLHQIPHGIMRMIPEKNNIGLVETSTNLAGIDIAEDRAVIRASNRSSSEASMNALKNMQRSIADCFHYNVTYSEGYPSWQPNGGSDLLTVEKEVYKGIYREGWNATVIHAGLECSDIVQKYRDDSQPMDCISIGPTIVDPHSGTERLKASTVEQFYEAVIKIIHRLYQR